MRFIHFPTFLISLVIGVFMVYMIQPEMKEIFVFPNPENINKLDYIDHTETCFRFQEEEVECPSNIESIQGYSVQ